MIIAVEGIDASGKATQTNLLASKLGGTVMAFPNYGSMTGAAIQMFLKDELGAVNATDIGQQDMKRLNGLVFQSLQAVNRYEVADEIRARAAAGTIVFDRYIASGIVYGEDDGLPRDWLRAVHSSLPQPDLWLLIDIPVVESFVRRPERRDRNESDAGLLGRVRTRYLRLFEEQRVKHLPWKVINGLGTQAEVHQRIMDVVDPIKLSKVKP